MNFSSRLHVIALVALAAGCSGSTSGVDLTHGSSSSGGSSSSSGNTVTNTSTTPDAAALFDAPTGAATAGTIFGLWGGVDDGNAGTSIDVRVKLTATTISNALRCTLTATQHQSGIVGVTAAARNTENDLVFLESKNDSFDDGTIRCSTSVAPRELKRCASDVSAGFEENCFTLEGTTLTLFGDNQLQKLELLKLSD